MLPKLLLEEVNVRLHIGGVKKIGRGATPHFLPTSGKFLNPPLSMKAAETAKYRRY